MAYTPPRRILDRYATVLVQFALGNGTGVQKGQVVDLRVPECAKPFLPSLYAAVLHAGAHPIVQYVPDGLAKMFFRGADDAQLAWLPQHVLKGRLRETDHIIGIIADHDTQELRGVRPERIMARQRAFAPYVRWKEAKENAGRLWWTIALYGTPAMAKEVGLSQRAYWQQIINACFLDDPDPVQRWKETFADLNTVKRRLDALAIDRVHVQSERTDLWLRIGPGRSWLTASGHNIPTFEVFISPDWRGTEGHIQFTQPLYMHDHLVTDAYLAFKNGEVCEVRASKGLSVLREMLKVTGGNRVGEFSLTSVKHSRITAFMGQTLYDENVGGTFGNTHIALGSAYKESYPGDRSLVSQKEWRSLGYNESVVHTDIVSTENRVVTAHLVNGRKKIIYKDGVFTV